MPVRVVHLGTAFLCLLITGAVPQNMRLALRKTYEGAYKQAAASGADRAGGRKDDVTPCHPSRPE